MCIRQVIYKNGDTKKAKELEEKAKNLHDAYGAGSSYRIAATAIVGAASGNVTGSMQGMAQAAAVGVLQSLTTTQVKKLIENSFGEDEDLTPDQKQAKETTRAALQALVGCAGAAASGQGDCAGGALGASASVVLNNLLSKGTSTATDKDGKPLSLDEQQERTNLIATLIAGLAVATGSDATSSVSASNIEGENNTINAGKKVYGVEASKSADEARKLWNKFFKTDTGEVFSALYGNQDNVKTCMATNAPNSCKGAQAKLDTLMSTFGDAKTINQQLKDYSPNTLVSLVNGIKAIGGSGNAAQIMNDIKYAANGDANTMLKIISDLKSGKYDLQDVKIANRNKTVAELTNNAKGFFQSNGPYDENGCFGALCVGNLQTAKNISADIKGVGDQAGIITAGVALSPFAPLALEACIGGVCEAIGSTSLSVKDAFLLKTGVGATIGGLTNLGITNGVNTLNNEKTTWGDGITSGLEGAVMGAVGANNPRLLTSVLAGTATGGAGGIAKQRIDIATGQQTDSFSWKEVGLDTVSGAIGGGVAKIPDLKVNKLTSGQNSFKAVYEATLTKIGNKNASNISISTVLKGATSSVVGDGLRDPVDAGTEYAKSKINIDELLKTLSKPTPPRKPEPVIPVGNK